jgi:hypothetical protein
LIERGRGGGVRGAIGGVEGGDVGFKIKAAFRRRFNFFCPMRRDIRARLLGGGG